MLNYDKLVITINRVKDDKKQMNNEGTTKKTDNLLSTKLYTLTDVEGILGVSHRTLLRWVAEDKIRAVKIGGKWKVSEDTLRAILEGKI